jgi:hypothetical protein
MKPMTTPTRNIPQTSEFFATSGDESSPIAAFEFLRAVSKVMASRILREDGFPGIKPRPRLCGPGSNPESQCMLPMPSIIAIRGTKIHPNAPSSLAEDLSSHRQAWQDLQKEAKAQ